jgi:hypothetical protein
MDRLRQILQNWYIRLEGLLYQLFGFFRKVFGWLYLRFVSFLRLLGFSTSSDYFVESDAVQNTKSVESQQLTAAKPEKVEPTPPPNRRRPDPQMDYYRNMAKQVKGNQ